MWHTRRVFMNRIITIHNIKIGLLIQSIVTTSAVLYIMYQTSTLDDMDANKWEIELRDGRCRGCCVVSNYTILAIAKEPHLSEKLHKFSRAIRKYDIPEDVMRILHDAEHKIEEFESELRKIKEGKSYGLSQLQGIFIEEDISEDQELVPKTKPKLLPESNKPEKPVTKSVLKTNNAIKLNARTKIPNDVHNEIVVNVPA